MNTPRNSRASLMAGLILSLALCTAGCGGYNPIIQPRIVTGMVVLPLQPIANSSAAPPLNQATFSAFVKYSDGTVTPVTTGVHWSYDSAQWVSFSGSTATCIQPAPQIGGNVAAPSQITATATVNGQPYMATSQLSCY